MLLFRDQGSFVNQTEAVLQNQLFLLEHIFLSLLLLLHLLLYFLSSLLLLLATSWAPPNSLDISLISVDRFALAGKFYPEIDSFMRSSCEMEGSRLVFEVLGFLFDIGSGSCNIPLLRTQSRLELCGLFL